MKKLKLRKKNSKKCFDHKKFRVYTMVGYVFGKVSEEKFIAVLKNVNNSKSKNRQGD